MDSKNTLQFPSAERRFGLDRNQVSCYICKVYVINERFSLTRMGVSWKPSFYRKSCFIQVKPCLPTGTITEAILFNIQIICPKIMTLNQIKSNLTRSIFLFSVVECRHFGLGLNIWHLTPVVTWIIHQTSKKQIIVPCNKNLGRLTSENKLGLQIN